MGVRERERHREVVDREVDFSFFAMAQCNAMKCNWNHLNG